MATYHPTVIQHSRSFDDRPKGRATYTSCEYNDCWRDEYRGTLAFDMRHSGEEGPEPSSAESAPDHGASLRRVARETNPWSGR
jgi:hypothetical protein